MNHFIFSARISDRKQKLKQRWAIIVCNYSSCDAKMKYYKELQKCTDK